MMQREKEAVPSTPIWREARRVQADMRQRQSARMEVQAPPATLPGARCLAVSLLD